MRNLVKDLVLRSSSMEIAMGIALGSGYFLLLRAAVYSVAEPLVLNTAGIYLRSESQFAGSNYTYPVIWDYFLSYLVAFLITLFTVAVIFRLRAAADLAHERECPACLSMVPLVASRCAFCRSDLLPVQTEASATS